MVQKESNVVLNFKMSGQVEYAKTIRDINAIMNAAASEYKTHVAAMGKDADQTKKLAAEKKKLEIQLEAGRKRTEQLRSEYESMAKSTQTTTGQLANKYKQLQNSERAEYALERALERVNEGLSEQAIESREAEKALNALEGEADSLETQTEKLNAEYELQVAQLGATAKEVDKLKLKTEQLNKEHELAKDKVKNHERQLEQAKKQYGENSREVDKYEIELIEARKAEQELANEIVTTNKQLKEQESVLKRTSDQLEKTGKKMTEVGKDLTKKVTLPIVGVGAASAKSAIDFESSFADVRKTVDETEEGFEKLSDGIREMSKELPTAASEIAGVTAMAGQLGIQNEHLMTFTRTMIDLGVATDMSGEQAATTLARLANITGMAQSDFDRLGSTIVDLGNNFAATEGEISEMAMRIAGAGSQINMSEADILGFSAALASVGIRAEAGGSAVSKLMIEIASDVDTGAERLEEFARVAGMSVDDFSKAFREDAATAIFTFLGGLGELSEEGESAFAIIDELGLSEIRLRDTILRTSNARDMANDALATANNAWQENSALEEEAAERYKTTASQLSILKNEIVDVAIDLGNILIPMILDAVDVIRPWIARFKEMGESTQRFIVIIGGIAAAIGPVLVVIGTLISSVGKIVGALGGWSVISAKIGTVLTALTGPIGIVIGAIAGLIAIFVALYRNNEEFRDKVHEIWENIKESFSVALEFIQEIVHTVITAVTEFFGEQLEKIKEFWDENGQQIIELVQLYFGMVWEYIQMVLGWIQGVWEVAWTFLSTSLRIIWEQIKLFVKSGIDFVLGTINTILAILRGDWEGAWESIKKTVENIWNNIKEFFENVDLVQTGKDIINGLISGIGSMIGSVGDAVKNVGSKIKDTFTNFFSIKSPSRVMRDLGKYITEGLGLGIEDEADFAVNKTQNVAYKVGNAMQDGIELPDLEIGTVVRQPNFSPQSSPMSALNNIGSNIKESLQGLSGDVNVTVYLDTDQVNTKLAPGMSKKLNNNNVMKARSQGVIMT